MRQFTVDYNISPELAAQIDVTITEQKNSINIRNFNLSGNSMEKDIRSISIDMTYKILFGASLIEGSIPALMGGEEIIGLYRPAITFATNPTIELDYLLNRTLNNLTEDLFYALRYHLRNVLSLPNLIRLEKLAEKYRDYQKLYKQISN